MKLFFTKNIKLFPQETKNIVCSYKVMPYFSTISTVSFRLDWSLLNLDIKQYNVMKYLFSLESLEICLVNCITKPLNFLKGQLIRKWKIILENFLMIILSHQIIQWVQEKQR